jgi:hypothetical protein
MARRKDKLKLSAFLLFTGHHVATWRHRRLARGPASATAGGTQRSLQVELLLEAWVRSFELGGLLERAHIG